MTERLRIAAITSVLLWSSHLLARNGQLEQAKAAYQKQDYRNAAAILFPLLYPRLELNTEDEAVEAHGILGLSYFFLGKTADAEQEVAAALALRPNYEPDPLLHPQSAIRFVESVRKRNEKRLEEIRSRTPAPVKIAPPSPVDSATTQSPLIHNSRLTALVPFGVGQWQNHQRKKAVFFAVSELVLGSVSLATWITATAKYPNRQYPAEEKSVAEGLLISQLSTGAAFWGVLIWGLIDAQVHFSALSSAGPTTGQSNRAARFQFAPMIGSDTAGLLLGGRF